MADLGVDDIARGGRRQGPGPRRRAGALLLPGKTPFMLEPKSPVLYFLQRLRDEAHRFAIGTPPRASAPRPIGAIPLDEIDGVGAGAQEGAAAPFRLGPRRRPASPI